MRMNTLEITVQKTDLQAALRQNREVHAEETRLAREGFRIELEKELATKLEKVRAGEGIHLGIEARTPDAHLEDYDDVIGMLELATESTFTITHEQYKCWVKNEWDWRTMWQASNVGYVTSARAAGL